MSLGNQKNLVVVAGIVVALLAATVLLAGYANIMPAKSDPATQAKACPGGARTSCGVAQAYFGDNTEASCPSQPMAAFNPESCPAGRTEPCCADDPPKDCCGEPCPPDCPKPCCAEQAEASGCCPAETATQ